ncbi:unnamed protein product [Arabidopsis halleri]
MHLKPSFSKAPSFYLLSNHFHGLPLQWLQGLQLLGGSGIIQL